MPRYPNLWIPERAGRGMTRMTVRAFDQSSGKLIASLSSEFSQTEIAKLIRDMCSEASLPAPWGRR